MRVQHVGYARKSRNGRALKLDLLLESVLTASRYTGRDGQDYVGLVINMSKLCDVLEGRKIVTNVSQIENEGGEGRGKKRAKER